MSVRLDVKIDKSGLVGLEPGPMKRAVIRALRKAGSNALRDMRSEATKRIKARKRIAPKYIRRAMKLQRAQGSNIESMRWAVVVSSEPIPLVAFPHRQTRKGVNVEVNRGKRTIVKRGFVARMASGHEGIFRRRGAKRLPIDELTGSRPIDALMHRGEAHAVATRGSKSFGATFRRVLPIEVAR